MDSLTQIVLGAAVAAVIAPPQHRRAALLAGAALGTLPDLDVLPVNLITDDPVARMTWHRGVSHSLLVLPFVAWAVWAWCRSRGGRVAQAPRRWFWAIQLALLTHPLLDAFTVYGTQLLWPLPFRPAMWSSVFIIDPLYTIWLLFGCAAAWFARARPWAQKALVLALALSTSYLGLSLLAKAKIERDAEAALAELNLADAPRFSVPMPFNILLWRVVAMTPDGFVEGERSLAADRGPMRFRAYRSDVRALAQVFDYPSVQRLHWFNRGFMKAEARDGALVLSDLRMGAEPDYSFRFAVAERDGEGWREIPPRQLQWPWQAGRRLGAMWRRIWHEPAEAPAREAVAADLSRVPAGARAGAGAQR
ncbi:metal-dependent hydrolase [Vulcaniibacterium tengchongense]|uniref:Inner membrane protein n=1 Tax=Vulcaniibacterium tengchongense TaxID=1273429 RepID=A0A3N4VNX3_9GAMM|nr:metal-dependent hydrolase [Vulcaniibacterium tengchongense]RPE80921.1 inner membrane protein [Vulcaniibacterium tengchongense]